MEDIHTQLKTSLQSTTPFTSPISAAFWHTQPNTYAFLLLILLKQLTGCEMRRSHFSSLRGGLTTHRDPCPMKRRSRAWLAPVKPTALQGEEVCSFFPVMSLWGLSDGVSDGSRLRSWSYGGGDRQKPPFSSPWPFEGSREAGKGRIVSLEMHLL